MRISAKADHALRALIELGSHDAGPLTAEQLAQALDLSPKFLEGILSQLRNHGLVVSRRGAEGGYWLARPAAQISVAQVVRASEGPLASVRGQQPEDVTYGGAAGALADVWIALRASLRSVLEAVTLADLVAGALPASVAALLDDPAARRTR
ncbi:MAG: Rrf2 family transcriptional regulator [Actinomycetota bacterium]|nr:Rrf2 family transcriptional regulator [Actinomycetota bacterium]